MNWISVEERLPELLLKVLFHWICPGGNRNISMGYRCDEGWDIYLPYHSFKMRPDLLKVTHWCELPDFPKADSRYIMPESEAHLTVRSIKIDTVDAQEFAKKFCEQNEDLLKRMANR